MIKRAVKGAGEGMFNKISIIILSYNNRPLQKPLRALGTFSPWVRAAFAAALVAGLAAWPARSQSRPSVLSARAVLAADGAYPGSTVKAAVVAEVAPGFHINDHKPTLDYLIPTELKLEVAKDLNADRIVYPKGQAKKFEFADTPLSVYEGTLVVGVVVKIARTVVPATYTIQGKLAYQACNEHACFPPSSVPVTLAVRVVPRGAALKRLNTDVFNKIQLD